MGCGYSKVTPISPPTSHQPDFDVVYKVIFIGDSNAGKTSIITRYIDNYFDINTQSTIGVDYRFKSVVTKDGKKAKISIWDSAGQERFRSIINSYYRGANIVVLVFDVSDKFNITQLDQWFDDINRYCIVYPKVILVGNKIDLPRLVDNNKVMEYVSTKNVKYIQVSAKTGEGITELFDIITNEL
jgi:small GTP-binding protein